LPGICCCKLRDVGRWHYHQSIATVGPVRGASAVVSLASTKNIRTRTEEDAMRRGLLIAGLIALAIGLLWIGQGTGAIAWPKTSFMINQIQWAGYGATLAAVGLILIWQSRR
jgi:hypothetical protein